jgi:hypothetical protein
MKKLTFILLGVISLIALLGPTSAYTATRVCSSYDITVTTRRTICTYRCVYCYVEGQEDAFYDSCALGLPEPNCAERDGFPEY